MTISPQAIAGATRRLLATTDWAWRYTDPSDPIELAATKLLRNDTDYASAWLWHVSHLTRQPLPAGNGVNGPWNRIGCITADGLYGVVDIALGLAVTYSVSVPFRVARFATPHSCAVSANEAGGSGGIPAGWRQIAITLGPVDSRYARRHRLPTAAAPLRAVWGYSTCYGYCGADPRTPGHSHVADQVAALAGAEWTETSEPQRIDVGFYPTVQEWDSFRAQRPRRPLLDRAQILIGQPGKTGRCSLHVYGMRTERDVTREELWEDWRNFALRTVLEQTYHTLDDMRVRVPLVTPPSRHDIPLRQGNCHLQAGDVMAALGGLYDKATTK